MRVPETPPNALGRGSRFWQMILEKSSDSAAVLKQLQDHLVSAIADCRKCRVRIADRVRNVTAIEFQNRGVVEKVGVVTVRIVTGDPFVTRKSQLSPGLAGAFSLLGQLLAPPQIRRPSSAVATSREDHRSPFSAHGVLTAL